VVVVVDVSDDFIRISVEVSSVGNDMQTLIIV